MIHPFLDGNGRVGRLLITCFLCQQEILQRPVVCLSHYLKRHRAEYYDRLQAVRDRGDWQGWLHLFVSGVLETSREATETARRILALREDHRGRITDSLAALGLLREITGQKRHRVFRYAPYLDLFADTCQKGYP